MTALKNFLKGMGSALDLFPENRKKKGFTLPTHSDAEAIRKDWEKVGEDIQDKILRYTELD